MAVQNSSRKWMFIGGGVVAAVALVIGFQNYPPQPKDSTGAIGAAQRYHEPQITGADVKVSQDELTTWIQSDTFDRIVKDPQARKLFTDAAVQQKLIDQGRQSLAVDGNGSRTSQRQVANDGAVDMAAKSGGKSLAVDAMDNSRTSQRQVANDGAVDMAAKSGGKSLAVDAMDNSRTSQRQVANDGAVDMGMKHAMELSPMDASLASIMNNDALRSALNNREFCEALSNVALRTALTDQVRRADAKSLDHD